MKKNPKATMRIAKREERGRIEFMRALFRCEFDNPERRRIERTTEEWKRGRK